MDPRFPSLEVIEDRGLRPLGGAAMRGPSMADRIANPEVLQAVREVLTQRVPVSLLDPVAPADRRNPAVLAVLRQMIGEQTEQGSGPLRGLPIDEESLLLLFRETIGWGPAQAYLDDPRIQEVKIIGDRIAVQEDGADFTLVPERFSTPRQVLDRAVLLAARLGVPLNRERPQATLPLAHGTRMHVTVPPCTPDDEALVCIRRGRSYAWTLDDVHRRGTFSDEVRDILLLLARARCSFLIAGETGSGKTALLEALINSWPGNPHVITIEDNTLEINVKQPMWTRELVQTSHEPGAFGRAAVNALRQTPTVLALGEVRANEAGAALTLAISGHAILTTLHAKNCAMALQRFADCAAMPGAFVYEGRAAHALVDAAETIEVLIHIEKLGGRRVITEIALPNGVEEVDGRVRPRLVEIVRMRIEDQAFVWHCAARAQGNELHWTSGASRTPPGLAQKLIKLNAACAVRAAPTTRAGVDAALRAAAQEVSAGRPDRARATLCRAWADRHDRRLVQAMAQTLETNTAWMHQAARTSEAAATAIEEQIRRRRWDEARKLFDTALNDLTVIAALRPTGRWEVLDQQIRAGEQADQALLARATKARTALDQGAHPQEVITILGADPSDRISPTVALMAEQVRYAAVRKLVASGEASAETLASMQIRLSRIATEAETPHG